LFSETWEYEVGIASNRKSGSYGETCIDLVHTARHAMKFRMNWSKEGFLIKNLTFINLKVKQLNKKILIIFMLIIEAKS
jgi:hypothetical protein